MVEQAKKLVEEIIKKEKEASEAIAEATRQATEMTANAERAARLRIDSGRDTADAEAKAFVTEQRQSGQQEHDRLKQEAQIHLAKMEKVFASRTPQTVGAIVKDLADFPHLEASA